MVILKLKTSKKAKDAEWYVLVKQKEYQIGFQGYKKISA